MKKLNNKGIGLLIPILAIAITLCIVGVGYYIYNSQNKNNISEDNSNETINQPIKTKNSVKKLAWKDVSVDLQSAVLDTWNSKSPGWNKPSAQGCENAPNNDNYSMFVDTNAAIGGLYCDSGAATLWARVDGNWKYIESTQGGFTCASVDKYQISKELILESGGGSDAKCYNYEAQTERNL